mgnify:FL=1
MDWGEKILYLRKRLDLTQKEVAKAVGIDDQTVSNWEQGKKKPKLDPAQTFALCKVLQCSLEELASAILDD